MAVVGKDADDQDVSFASEVAGVETGTHRPVHVVAKSALPTGAATDTLQTAGNATLTAIQSKIIAAPATEAKQDTQITALGSLLTALGTLGTQTTLAAVLAKIIAAPATEAKQDTTITALGTLATTTAVNAVTTAVGLVQTATEAITTSLAARFGTLGQKTSSGSAPVVLSSDHPAVGISNAALDDSIKMLAPTIAGTGALLTIGATSSAEAQLPSTGYYNFKCHGPAVAGMSGYYIVFGDTGMAAASATNGWLVEPGETLPVYITSTTRYFRAIRHGSSDAIGKYSKAGA